MFRQFLLLFLVFLGCPAVRGCPVVSPALPCSARDDFQGLDGGGGAYDRFLSPKEAGCSFEGGNVVSVEAEFTKFTKVNTFKHVSK